MAWDDDDNDDDNGGDDGGSGGDGGGDDNDYYDDDTHTKFDEFLQALVTLHYLSVNLMKTWQISGLVNSSCSVS